MTKLKLNEINRAGMKLSTYSVLHWAFKISVGL